MLNEVVFLHEKSSTLVVADAFYSGHCCGHEESESADTQKQSYSDKIMPSKSATEKKNDQSLASDMEINHRSKYEHQLNPPNVFTRVWFKLTKEHWCSSQLPSYRTSRVISDGDPEELLTSIKGELGREIRKIQVPMQKYSTTSSHIISFDPTSDTYCVLLIFLYYFHAVVFEDTGTFLIPLLTANVCYPTSYTKCLLSTPISVIKCL